MEKHTPTETGLKILDDIKAKYFPNGFSASHRQGAQDYRFSRKGQAEFKRAHMMRRALLGAPVGFEQFNQKITG